MKLMEIQNNNHLIQIDGKEIRLKTNKSDNSLLHNSSANKKNVNSSKINSQNVQSSISKEGKSMIKEEKKI